MALNDRKVKAAKWEGEDKRLCDGKGLYLQIRKSSKTWIIRRRKKIGDEIKNQIKTLGKYPDISLKEARTRAALHASGPNPDKVLMTDLVDQYMEKIVMPGHKRPELVQGYVDRAIIPVLGRRKVVDITTFELVNLVEEYAKRGPRTADQLRSNLKSIFGYAVEKGICKDNPMVDVTRRVSGYEGNPRDRVLSDDEIKLLWRVENRNADLLRFLLLTGLRISEARLGHRKGDRWMVPAQISKNGEAHWVCLTKSAEAQLPLPKSTATNIQAWLRRWCNKQGINPRFTPHDLRRTAATRMANSGVAPFIVERVLNHKLQGVMQVYNQAEYEKERIEAAGILEQIILDIVSGGGRNG